MTEEYSDEELDENGLEECCLDTLPRKITADKSFFRSIAPVLSALQWKQELIWKIKMN